MRSVRHRAADVEHQMAVEIGFFFELLDVKAVAARVDLPVDRGQIVAGDVLPVLGELDAEALERTAMQAGEEPFDDGACFQFERAEPGDDRRIKERALGRGPGHATSRSWEPARSRADG